MCRHHIDLHCYADDTQLYVPLKPGTTDVPCIMSCLTEIKNWMSKHFPAAKWLMNEIIFPLVWVPFLTMFKVFSSD